MISKKPMRFSGRGGVAEIFRGLQALFLVDGALLHFFTFQKGGPRPPGPPPESATEKLEASFSLIIGTS